MSATRSNEINPGQAFLDANPSIEVVEVMLPDTSGVLRGKWLPRSALPKLYENGMRLPRSTFALDIWGQEVPGSGLIVETGDTDGTCQPVPGTLKPAPWLKRNTAQVLTTMFEANGTPFFGDPRQVLSAVLSRFTDRGLTPVVATELEFYLLDRVKDPTGRPQPPVSPLTGERQVTAQVYGLDELQEFEELLADMAGACAAQDIPADTVIAENAPGQYEINLTHVSDALLAADHAVLMKRAIKGVARMHGFDATFMAKPYGDRAGNGMHVHFSLLDEDGANVFDDGTHRGSETLLHALGGLTSTMQESTAVFAPNANSYRRFQRGSHAPMAPTWGYDNRSAALRIPQAGGPATRIEHRVAGADANPYLALAAILGGALHGIVNRSKPSPATIGDTHVREGPRLPSAWIQALELFENSTFIGDSLGADYRKLYSACKRQELDAMASMVTNVEYDAYLRTV